MTHIKTIYLAGSVPKSDDGMKKIPDWRRAFIDTLQAVNPDLVFFNPRENRVDENDPHGVFGMDCMLVRDADALIVYAPDKIGIGTAQEMMVAKYFHHPVITVLPQDTYLRRKNLVHNGITISDWIHPFVHETSDIIVASCEELPAALEKVVEMTIKDLSCIDDAITYYENHCKNENV